MNDSREHETRFSDSSYYDEVCTKCWGTDANGDDSLNFPCEGNPKLRRMAQIARKVENARRALREALEEQAAEEVLTAEQLLGKEKAAGSMPAFGTMPT